MNRRKVDLIPLPAWAEPPKAKLPQLLAAVETRLAQAGISGGLPQAIELALTCCREAGLADARVTSDAKYLELGLTDKTHAASYVFDWLGRRGLRSEQVLIAGDELGPLGGCAGSDSLMLIPASDRAISFSVGPEPNGVPAGRAASPGRPRALPRPARRPARAPPRGRAARVLRRSRLADRARRRRRRGGAGARDAARARRRPLRHARHRLERRRRAGNARRRPLRRQRCRRGAARLPGLEQDRRRPGRALPEGARPEDRHAPAISSRGPTGAWTRSCLPRSVGPAPPACVPAPTRPPCSATGRRWPRPSSRARQTRVSRVGQVTSPRAGTWTGSSPPRSEHSSATGSTGLPASPRRARRAERAARRQRRGLRAALQRPASALG